MRGIGIIGPGAVGLLGLLLACSGTPRSGGGAGAATAQSQGPAASQGPQAERDTPTTPEGGAGPGQRMGQGAMMGHGGMMGQGRMAGMMGGQADTAAAPQARATSATASGCPPVSQARADRGRTIFAGAGNCYTCHGSNAQGTALAPDLTDSQWLDTDGSYGGIVAVVQGGVPHPKQHPAPMPPKGGAALDVGQVCAVAAYVYSLSHAGR